MRNIKLVQVQLFFQKRKGKILGIILRAKRNDGAQGFGVSYGELCDFHHRDELGAKRQEVAAAQLGDVRKILACYGIGQGIYQRANARIVCRPLNYGRGWCANGKGLHQLGKQVGLKNKAHVCFVC